MASNVLHKILRVNNIPWTVSQYELALYFSQFGHVVSAFVKFDKKTGFHQGFGNVTFWKKEDVEAILNRQHFLEGNNLVLSKVYVNNNSEPNNQNKGVLN